MSADPGRYTDDPMRHSHLGIKVMGFAVRAMALVLIFLTLLLGAVALARPAHAVEYRCVAKIGNDRGGVIEAYEQVLEGYNRRNCLVKITGRAMSSATIYLGADRVCVERNAVAVFHAPSWGGRKMAPVDFAYWKERLASHYPRPIAQWYLMEIRNDLKLHRVTGAELINMGMEECES